MQGLDLHLVGRRGWPPVKFPDSRNESLADGRSGNGKGSRPRAGHNSGG